MNDLEELLRDAMTAEVNAEPPPGMEDRIRTALLLKRRRSAPVWSLWREAVAAMLVIGVAGIWVRHYRVAVSTEHHAAAVSVANAPGMSSGTPQEEVADAAHKPASRYVAVGNRSSPPRPTHARRTRLQDVPAVEALSIPPLVVQPIEVASLDEGKSTE